ncbi:MAG: S8 family serine peptidase [Pirellulales bacterium]
MNRPTWRDISPDARRTLRVWKFTVAMLFSAAIPSTAVLPAMAQSGPNSQDIGYSDVFIQSGSGAVQGSFVGNYNMNTLLGADRFYSAGYTGANTVMANIEAGYIWTGHETLGHVTKIPTSGAAGEFDRHATWVGMIMGGRTGGPNPGEYQHGMAPDAQLASGAIAQSWPAGNSSYPRFTTAFYLDTYGLSTFGPYRAAFVSGVPTSSGLRRADVVNSSWVFSAGDSDLAGSDNLSGTFDALVNENPRTLFTVAAGNTVPSGAGPNRVPSPASAYNTIAVAALNPDSGAFDVPSYFSNGGPNDYYDPVNGTVPMARQVVDIAAPGENLAAAYYGGQTGGNGVNVFGSANGPAGGADYYSRNINGTSFAAPTVAGGAALLYDAAYAALPTTPDARDSRVMKAVLMNSAVKTQDWDNGQFANPNGLGGVFTSRGVDDRVGAGRMDLNRAFDQLLSGTTDVAGLAQGALGNVAAIGWDFGQVGEGTTNDYLITNPLAAGDIFTATLTWFRDRHLIGDTTYGDDSFDNLDLELWSSAGGIAQDLISASNGRYNNTEHFSFAVPTTGQYMIRVRWSDELFDTIGDLNAEQYGLAWSSVAVPEPAVFWLVAGSVTLLSGNRFRRKS